MYFDDEPSNRTDKIIALIVSLLVVGLVITGVVLA